MTSHPIATSSHQSCTGLVGAFERQVRQHADAPAVTCAGETITYRELNSRANRLADLLVLQGVGSEEIVALALPKSIDLIVGMLAALKSRAAYLPLELAQPAERMASILADARPRVALTHAGLTASGQLPSTATNWLAVDSTACQEALDGPNSGDLVDHDRPEADPMSPAYVIYTSGSTGRPKGVVVSHHNVVRLFESTAGLAQFHSDDVSCLFLSHSFDFSGWEIWGALLHGGRLIIPPAEVTTSADDLLRFLVAEGVTVLSQTPSAFYRLIDADAKTDALRIEGRLRMVLVGGERLDFSHLERWYRGRSVDSVKVINGYAPTETTILATYEVLDGESASAERESVIGVDVADMRTYVLDSNLRLVPIGEIGELFVAGSGLARGYLNSFALTADRFVPDLQGSGERMYRTGDLVSRRTDGRLVYHGRNDDQVKVHGFRVELGEIEAALGRHAEVAQCAVLLRDTDSTPQLVAYVVPAGESEPASGELVRHLKDVLPAYMVPSSYLIMSELPVTTNGKVDRRRLPEPGPLRVPVSQSDEGMTPRAILGRLFAEVLGFSEVSPDDDFFALGGDSIVAIQLVNRARQAGLVITPLDLFQCRTVTAVSAAAKVLSASAPMTADEPIGDVPATPILRWLYETEGSAAQFAHSVFVWVPGTLTRESLLTGLQALLDTQDALRIRVTPNDGGATPTFMVPPVGSSLAADCLRTVDISDLHDDGTLRSVISRERDAALDRLDPEAGVMVQAVLFHARADQPGRLLLVIHHLVVDGVSWRIILPTLAAAVESGPGDLLAPQRPGTSFRRWAGLLVEESRREARVAELSYWKSVLEGSSVMLPGRALDPAVDVHDSAGTLRVTLPPTVTNELLTRVPAGIQGTVNDVLLTALALAVASWTARDGRTSPTGVRVDCESHGREEGLGDIDLSRTVGWFTALYPVRLDPGQVDWSEVWTGGAPLTVAIKRIMEQLRAVPENGIGYGLLRYINPDTAAELSAAQDSQICFNYLGRFAQSSEGFWDLGVEHDAVTGHGHGQAPTRHPLTVDAVVHDRIDGPHLEAKWTWAPAISERVVRELAEDWLRALRALVHWRERLETAGHSPSDFPLVRLTQADVDRLDLEHPGLADVLPLSPLQEGLLFHTIRRSSASDAYTAQVVVDLAGPLHVPTLRRAVTTLLNRHPHLSAVFAYEEFGRPVQVVPRACEVRWQELDLAGYAAEHRRVAMEEVLVQDRRRGFPDVASPLIRFLLVKSTTGQHHLVLTAHHLLVDGWSVQILLRELLELYVGKGEGAGQPPAPAYSHYLAWLADQDAAAAKEAWSAALADVAEPTRIGPPDHESRTAPERVYRDLSPALTMALNRAARENGVTLNTLFQVAWALLLARLTDRTDVVFGNVVTIRPADLPNVEDMVGLFTNTVPVRVRVQAEEPIDRTLRRLQDTRVNLSAHDHLALAEIQQAAGHGDLFDTLLVFENYPVEVLGAETSADVSIAGTHFTDPTHYPLTIFVVPRDQVTLRLDYDSELFDQDTAETLLTRLTLALTAIAEDVGRPNCTVDILEPNERRRILEDWNDTTAPFNPTCLHELFNEQVKRRADEVAVIGDDWRLSYGDVDRRANQIAHLLRDRGVGPDVPVAVLLDRGPDLIPSILGILKAGGAYLPVGTEAPIGRVRRLLDSARPPVSLVTLAWSDVVRDSGSLPIEPAEVVGHQGKGLAASGTLPDNLAAVFYTSGSTGAPKGVMCTHRGWANRLLWMQRSHQLGPGQVVLHKTPLSFGDSVVELLWPLLVGGTVAMVAPGQHGNPAEIARAIDRFDVVHVQFVPGMLELFMDCVRDSGARLESLRTILSSGEALRPDVAERFHRQFADGIVLDNTYGMTEASIDSTLHICAGADNDQGELVPIGRPIDNCQVFVLGPDLEPVPAGVVADIYVSGTGLARGYLNDPARTAAVFTPNPYRPGERMYRTGDRGYHRPDGELVYVGRTDHQVKVRGARIELGEVEAAFRAHPLILDCAVDVWERVSGDRNLAAYVVPLAGATPSSADVIDHVKELLPRYAIPSAVIVLDALPRNPNGKVDRRALPNPQFASPQAAYVPPQTVVEQAVAEVWCAALGVERVGRHDNFFTLGGHSLLALRVGIQLGRRFGTVLSPNILFEGDSLEEVAALLEDAIVDDVESMTDQQVRSVLDIS